jgi:hypothetical protein
MTLLIFEELILNIKGIHGIIFYIYNSSNTLQGGSDYLGVGINFGRK